MRLSIASNSSAVGDVNIHEVFRVIELDAGHCVGTTKHGAPNGDISDHTNRQSNVAFLPESLNAIESRIAIVIPCMNEERDVLEGVLQGVPNKCLIILVSNSRPTNFENECKLLANFSNTSQRPAIAIHQQDEGLARAFHAAGMPLLVMQTTENTIRVHDGKGEAMMIGVAIAKLAGKHFIGFIDADNLVSGAVHEYCEVYAAGLHYALYHTSTMDPHAMVRIKWNSKPKVRNNELIFEKSGRSSRVVNEWMNRLLDELVDGHKQNGIIQTANAGEHAMSLDLALGTRFATGYAVEPFQLVDSWERFGGRCIDTDSVEQLHAAIATYRDADEETHASDGSTPRSILSPISTPPTPADPRKIHIIQVETRNPHFHDCSKGEGHITRMQIQGLSTIYHSALTPQKLKNELQEYMKVKFPEIVGSSGVPERMRVYPPMNTMNFQVFREIVKGESALQIVGNWEGKAAI